MYWWISEIESNARFRIIPSLRFEYFLTLLKNAQFIIGNSSAEFGKHRIAESDYKHWHNKIGC
jgi:hypothetical protein